MYKYIVKDELQSTFSPDPSRNMSNGAFVCTPVPGARAVSWFFSSLEMGNKPCDQFHAAAKEALAARLLGIINGEPAKQLNTLCGILASNLFLFSKMPCAPQTAADWNWHQRPG